MIACMRVHEKPQKLLLTSVARTPWQIFESIGRFRAFFGSFSRRRSKRLRASRRMADANKL